MRWIAVGTAYEPGQWAQLSPDEQKHEIIFTKDYKGTYKSATEEYTDDMLRSGESYIYVDYTKIVLGDPRMSDRFWVMVNGVRGSTDYSAPYSIDTMVLISGQGGPAFLMQRQK